MSTTTIGAAALDRPGLLAALERINPKYLVTFLITLILVLGEWQYSILGGYERLALALGSCVLTELALSRLVRGDFASIASAYVSGISLSLLTKPQASILWPFVLGGVIAISSKYVLSYRGRHLWNPTNFAIGVMVLLAPSQIAILSHQWGNDLATNAVIWTFGLLIASRARVLHVTLSYLIAFVVLALARNAIVGGPLLAELAPVTGPMYQLFIFFMITDPRTTVSSRRGRIAVAVLIALVEAAIRLGGDLGMPATLRPLLYSPAIYALFLVGPVAMFIDRLRHEPSTSKPAPQPAS